MPIGSMPSVTIDARHVLHVLEEFLEPALEVQAVPQHQVGVLRLDDVERRRLVVVDLGAGLGDRLDHGLVARDVLRHVLDDGEGRHHAELLARGRRRLRMAFEVGEPKYHESERDEARTCQGDGPGSEPPEPISVHRVLLNVRAVPNSA